MTKITLKRERGDADGYWKISLSIYIYIYAHINLIFLGSQAKNSDQMRTVPGHLNLVRSTAE